MRADRSHCENTSARFGAAHNDWNAVHDEILSGFHFDDGSFLDFFRGNIALQLDLERSSVWNFDVDSLRDLLRRQAGRYGRLKHCKNHFVGDARSAKPLNLRRRHIKSARIR